MKRWDGFLLGWLWVTPLMFLGCTLADNPPSARPSNEQPRRTVADPRTPSSLQAMQRGVTSVTPPGSPLQDIFFEFDAYDLPPHAREGLKANAEWLKYNDAQKIEIEGHCDDLGTSEYNLALGLKRAQEAKDYLMTLGIPPERLSVISYGKEAPACLEQTEECRKKNRRARFIIVTILPTS
jgi:peptidoglycan-associated lipoprotein